jgi:nitrate/nitrite transporter NarK
MDANPQGKFLYGYVIAASCFAIQAVGIGTFLLMGFLGMGVGRLNDRIGPIKLMTVTGVFFGLGYLLMVKIEAVWQLYVFFGIIFGIAMFNGNFGGAIGPFLTGYIFDVTAGYAPAIWICTLISALAFVLIWLLEPVGESKTLIR